MASRQDALAARTIKRLRGLVRDLARIETMAAAAAAHRAAHAAQAADNAVIESLDQWHEAIGQPRPDPVLFGLARGAVVQAQANHRAALLDQSISDGRRDLAAAELARAEAKLEGSRISARALARDRRQRAADWDSREVEDAFLRRRHR